MHAKKAADSKGQHYFWIQQARPDDCGSASVAMTEIYYKGHFDSGAEDRAMSAANLLKGDSWNWNSSSINNATNPINHRDCLRHEHVDAHYRQFGEKDMGSMGTFLAHQVSTKKVQMTPAILSLKWDAQLAICHAIVCIRVYPDSIVFLDPANGLVEIPVLSLPAYQSPTLNRSGTFTGSVVYTIHPHRHKKSHKK
jgi:hypothetical protein